MRPQQSLPKFAKGRGYCKKFIELTQFIEFVELLLGA